MDDRDEFFYPRSRYYGQVKLANLVVNANLQEFAQKVGYISNLETSGKLSPEEAYKQIKALWKQFNYGGKRHYISTGLAADEIVLMFLMPLLRSQPSSRELCATLKRGNKFANI